MPLFLKCWHVLITSPLYVYTYFDRSVLHVVYITRIIVHRMHTSSHLCRILHSGYGFFTLKQNQFYMELRLSTSYERYFFGVIGFHPEAIKILYGASVIKVTTRNVLIYDESFMTFLNSVTIAHNS